MSHGTSSHLESMSHGTCNPPEFTSHGMISGGGFMSHGTCNSILSALSHASRLSAFGCLRCHSRPSAFRAPNSKNSSYNAKSLVPMVRSHVCIAVTDIFGLYHSNGSTMMQKSLRRINTPDLHHPTIPKPKLGVRDTNTEDNSIVLVTHLTDGGRRGIDVEWDRLGATTIARRIASNPQPLAIAIGG